VYYWGRYDRDTESSHCKKNFGIIICNSFLRHIFAALITKERRLLPMLIIPIKEGENIDRALKRFKRKFDKTGTMRQLRKRQQFTKPSVENRAKIQKAQYIQGLRDKEEI
jgi:small subunit ribosomal protein S21